MIRHCSNCLFSMDKGVWHRMAYCGHNIVDDEIYYRSIDDFLSSTMRPTAKEKDCDKTCAKCFDEIERKFFKRKEAST